MGTPVYATLYWLVMEGATFSPWTAMLGAAAIAGWYIYDYYYGTPTGGNDTGCGGGPCE